VLYLNSPVIFLHQLSWKVVIWPILCKISTHNQVDDQEEESKKAKKESKVRKRKQKEKRADDKYKGYEILLDAEDDTNYSPPKGMSFIVCFLT
jgi:hypothetical protein